MQSRAIRHVYSEPNRAGRPVRVASAEIVGVDARLVEIEASARGNSFSAPRILGLPDAAVREAYHRVRTAFHSLHLNFPRGQIVVNLAPACTRKGGTGFDLPIALALACLAGALPSTRLRGRLAVGELGLDGSLRAVPGTLAAAELCARLGVPGLLCAEESAALAARGAREVGVAPATTLVEAIEICCSGRARPITEPLLPAAERRAAPDLARVRGQETACEALVIAAAGGHNILMSGPPGCGKTLLASCLAGLLPRLTEAERLELARIRGAFGVDDEAWRILATGTPPFRAPHHTVSYAGLVGGGRPIRPGEITLAHRGVLFLDEFPEFQRATLEALRQPLEAGRVHIRRAHESIELPARIQLVAAMNPCPCGNLGHPRLPCGDTPAQVRRYRSRISAPLLDRMDLQLDLVPVDPGALFDQAPRPPRSAELRRQIGEVRAAQLARNGGVLNAELDEALLRDDRHVSAAARRLVLAHCERGTLSARALTRVLRVARTVADLAEHERIDESDLATALGMRLRVAAEPLR